MVTLPTATDANLPWDLAESRRSFLDASALQRRWARRRAFTILETGFGAGIEFLAAWDAWRGDAERPGRLHFIATEHRPLSHRDLVIALQPLDAIAPLARALENVWPPPLAGYHRLHFDGGKVVLTLLFGETGATLPQLQARVDAFFLDGLATARDAGIWSPAAVRELTRLAAPGATFSTRTLAQGVRASLADAGFEVAHAGDSGAGILTGSWPGTACDSVCASHALVIGAGLAGTLVAERLAARDWEVDLLDARPRSLPAVGLLRPIANLRDALNARASRSAFLYALQHFRALQYDGYHLQWERTGILQLAGDEDEAARLAAIAGSQGYPDSFLRFVDAAAAAELAGRPVRGAGWHFPSGAWVSPESLAIASLARGGDRIHKQTGCAVARIAHEAQGWTAYGSAGEVLGRAPHMVLANAAAAARLLPEARLTLSSVRGQVSYLLPDGDRALALPVSGSGYVAPHPDGGHVIGASFQHDDDEGAVRAADHRENLARAESMLPGFTAGLHPMGLDGWAGFRATVPDRLPIFGATALPGAWTATGLGSRGLLWGPLGAELVACAASGEPLPLPRDLVGAISPLRFLS